MATKRGLAERVLKMLNPKLTQDSKVTLQEMAIAVGNARDYVVTSKLFQAYNNPDVDVYGGYIKEYGYEPKIYPKYDYDKNYFYIDMPAFPLDLPNNSGIREVGLVGCEGEDTFIPLQAQSKGLYKNLYGNNAQLPRVGYWFEGYRMPFSKPLSTENGVYIKMIPKSEDLDDRDEFYLSPDDETSVISMVLETYGGLKGIPEDNANNNIEG